MKSAARACLDLVENFVSSENYHAYQEILTEKQIHYLPKNEKANRWISIGRLDINTSGLMLFTNNGDFANFCMHPSSQIDREYLVRARGIF